MQIINFTSPLRNILFIIALWAAIQVTIPFVCLKISAKWLLAGSALFKTYNWEKNGDVYNKVFKIKKWKHLLPDGGAVIKSGFKKKHIDTSSKDTLRKFIVESCRAELVHWLLILPFWVVGFFAPPVVILGMLIYALVANLPCIIAQRYNRPRIEKLLTRIETREEKVSKDKQ